MSSNALAQDQDANVQGFHFGWFLSLLLAGAAGFALMLGALYSATDHKLVFAEKLSEVIDDSKVVLSGQADRSAYGAQKSHRLTILPLLAQIESEKETVELAKTVEADGKSLIRVVPYTRIRTELARTKTPLTDEIKGFNPISLMTAAAEIQKVIKDRGEGDGVFVDNSEVTLSVSDLSLQQDWADKDGLVDDFVLEMVRPFIKSPQLASPSLNAGIENQAISLDNIVKASAVKIDPVAALDDFQVLTIQKTPYSALIENIETEHLVEIQPDDELALVLSNAGIGVDDLDAIMDAIQLRFDLNDLSAGQSVRIGFGRLEPGNPSRAPIRISLFNEFRPIVSVGRTNTGRYVPLELSGSQLAGNEAKSSISLYRSIYETALRARIPRPLIDQMIHIFSFDIDYRRQVGEGDSLELVFDRDESELENAQLLHASLTLDGKEKSFFRFKTTDDSYIDYYDATGRSAKKFLIRKPMHYGEFRSGFGMRRHPITRRYRMHNGVDWRAPRGTIIVAAGDGRIAKASWAGGYGRQVKIQHKHGYLSSYSHLQRFASGIREGTYVRQGQVIGYVGTSGLSTGPHLHYELHVNSRKVDPMGVRLPRGRTLGGTQLSLFQNQQDLINEILTHPGKGSGNLLPAPILPASNSAIITKDRAEEAVPMPTRRPSQDLVTN